MYQFEVLNKEYVLRYVCVFQKYQFEVLNEEYVLRDVLGQPSPDGPYILASRVVDVEVSTPVSEHTSK